MWCSGAGWGWSGSILTAAVLLVFWGAVIASLITLFGTTPRWRRLNANVLHNDGANASAAGDVPRASPETEVGQSR